MKTLIKTILTFMLLTSFATSMNLLAHGSRLAIKNVRILHANLMTGGQPEKSDFEKLNRKGVKTVINLRPKGEFNDYDEAAEAKKKGLKYHLLEISGDKDITKENAIKLDKLLGKERTLVHCASGNRVGALLALREYYVKGKSAKASIAVGKSAGMADLSDKVEQLLKQASSDKAKDK